MIYEVPILRSDPSFTQEVDLDGTTFQLLFRWNDREEFWYMSILDVDGVMIAASRKLVPGAFLLRHFTDMEERPQGEFMMIGTPGRYTLGTETTLLYLDAEELA